jgi:hypothetical protein
MDTLRHVSAVAGFVLPFLAAIFQLIVAYDNRSRPWRFIGAIACAVLFMLFGFLQFA